MWSEYGENFNSLWFAVYHLFTNILLSLLNRFSYSRRISKTTFETINTRTGGGGGGGAKNAHPSGFSRIAEKRRRAAPPFFQFLLTIELDTLCKNFSPRSPKVRSPGQVKVKNGFLTLRLRSGHIRYPIGFKPSAFHKVIDTYNLYISDFLYLSPEVRSIS